MASSNAHASPLLVRLKLTADLAKHLEPLPVGHRSEYLRGAMEDWISRNPVPTSLPLDEGPDETIVLNTSFTSSPKIAGWLSRVPMNLRSYLVRAIVRDYIRRRPPPGNQLRMDPERGTIVEPNAAIGA